MTSYLAYVSMMPAFLDCLYDTQVSFGLYDASFLSLSLWHSSKLRSLWRELQRVLTKMACFNKNDVFWRDKNDEFGEAIMISKTW